MVQLWVENIQENGKGVWLCQALFISYIYNKNNKMVDEIRVSQVDGQIEIEAGDPSFGGYDGWVGYFPKDIARPFAISLGSLKRKKGQRAEMEYDGDEIGFVYDLQPNGVGTKGKYTMFCSQHQELRVKETLEDNEFKDFLRDLVKAIKG